MANYEKLCESLDITKQPHNYYCSSNVWHYPVFSEEKQMSLLKLILRGHKIEIFFMKNGSEEYGILCYNQLSEVALNLIKIDKLNKDEVKRILE